jgi:hypothetical protein
MSTNSSIAIKNEDGSVTAIYCHWDGNIEHNGHLLAKHYTTEEKVRELLALGNLSILGEVVGVKVDFDTYRTPSEGTSQCVAYGRDRGEHNQQAVTFPDRKKAMDFYSSGEYHYLFDNGVWTVISAYKFIETSLNVETVEGD